MDELYILHPLVLFDSTIELDQKLFLHFGRTVLVSLYNYFEYYKSNSSTFKLEETTEENERFRKELVFDIIIHAESGLTGYPNTKKWNDWKSLIKERSLFKNHVEFARYMGKYLSHPRTVFYVFYMRTSDRRLLNVDDSGEDEGEDYERFVSRSMGGKSKEFYASVSSNLNFWNMPSYVGLLSSKIAVLDDKDPKTISDYKETLENIERVVGHDRNVITLTQIAAYLISGKKVANDPFVGFAKDSLESKWLGKLMYHYLKSPSRRGRKLSFVEYCRQTVERISNYFYEERKEELGSFIERISRNDTNWWKLIEEININ